MTMVLVSAHVQPDGMVLRFRDVAELPGTEPRERPVEMRAPRMPPSLARALPSIRRTAPLEEPLA
jgi:hypothetical protein